MKTRSRLLSIFLSLLIAGLACNLPSTVNSTPQAATLDALYNTSAAQTVSAVELTSTPMQTSTGVPSPTNPLLTLTPISTLAPIGLCDAAYFIKDVTIPDGTVLRRGTNFTKNLAHKKYRLMYLDSILFCRIYQRRWTGRAHRRMVTWICLSGQLY